MWFTCCRPSRTLGREGPCCWGPCFPPNLPARLAKRVLTEGLGPLGAAGHTDCPLGTLSRRGTAPPQWLPSAQPYEPPGEPAPEFPHRHSRAELPSARAQTRPDRGWGRPLCPHWGPCLGGVRALRPLPLADRCMWPLLTALACLRAPSLTKPAGSSVACLLSCLTVSKSPCEKLISKGSLSPGGSASLPPQSGSRDGLPALNTKILFPSECSPGLARLPSPPQRPACLGGGGRGGAGQVLACQQLSLCLEWV